MTTSLQHMCWTSSDLISAFNIQLLFSKLKYVQKKRLSSYLAFSQEWGEKLGQIFSKVDKGTVGEILHQPMMKPVLSIVIQPLEEQKYMKSSHLRQIRSNAANRCTISALLFLRFYLFIYLF